MKDKEFKRKPLDRGIVAYRDYTISPISPDEPVYLGRAIMLSHDVKPEEQNFLEGS